MTFPICVPTLESQHEPVRVGTWLVDIGQFVETGDRVVELELTGMVYVVSAAASGRIEAIAQPQGRSVRQGEVLAWLEDAQNG